MTATLTTGFANHVKRRSQQRCRMLRLELTDGTALGFTDHDQSLDFDLGDGSVTYRPDFGMQISNIQTGTGLDAANFEVTFPIGASPRPITLAAILGGRFHRCQAKLFDVVWSDLSAGSRAWVSGKSGEWRVEGDKAIAEIRDDRDRLNQTVGRQLQTQCDADYGDQVRCFATPLEANETVTAVVDSMRFTVTNTDSNGDNVFNRGKVGFTTGGNTGIRPVPIESWTAAGVVTLFMPLAETPVIGDTVNLKDGCARTRTACMAHGQILNYRGFPEVPGVKALTPEVPPASGGGGGKGGGK